MDPYDMETDVEATLEVRVHHLRLVLRTRESIALLVASILKETADLGVVKVVTPNAMSLFVRAPADARLREVRDRVRQAVRRAVEQVESEERARKGGEG